MPRETIDPDAGPFVTSAVGRNTRHLFGRRFFIPGIGWIRLTDKGKMNKKGPPGIDIAVSNREQMLSPRFNRVVNLGGENVPLTAYIAGNRRLDPTGGGPLDALGNPVVPYGATRVSHAQEPPSRFGEFSAPAENSIFNQGGQLQEGAQSATESGVPFSNSETQSLEPGAVQSETPDSGQSTATWQDYSTPEQLSGLGAEWAGITNTPIEMAQPETTPVSQGDSGVSFNTGAEPLTFGDLQSGSAFIPNAVNFQAPGNSGEETFSPPFDPNTPSFSDPSVTAGAYAAAFGSNDPAALGFSTVPLVGSSDSGVPGTGSNDLSVVGAEGGPSWSESSSPAQDSGNQDQGQSTGPYGLSQDPGAFAPDLTISPGVGGPFSDANLLPGATSSLGSFGGGNLGRWNPMRNMWYGRHPYTPENYNNLLGWNNYQGNAIGQTPTPQMSYQDYLNTWNQLRTSGRTAVGSGGTWADHSQVVAGPRHAGPSLQLQ